MGDSESSMARSRSASASELSLKLETYSEQLQQVEKVLESDPDNEQFLKLRNDLVEVRKLTEDLFNYKSSLGEEAPEEEEEEETVIKAFEVGARCEAMYQGKWYPAVVTKVSEKKYTVVYIGFGNTEVVETVRPLVTTAEVLDSSVLVPGFECSARYSGDGKYYEATIDEATTFGYRVTFTEYGNQEELPLEYIRDREVLADDDNEMTRGVDGTYRIPEHLRLQPSDTEAERQRKRRRVKALKQQIKTKEMDQQRDAKQTNWQAFQNRGAKRKVTGSLKTLRKESIFKAPETVDGKVGVTGSGRGTTEYDDGRKKKQFKFRDAQPDYW